MDAPIRDCEIAVQLETERFATLGCARISSAASVADGHARLVAWLLRSAGICSVAASISGQIVQDERQRE